MAKNGQIEFLLSVADVLLIDKESKAQLASATLKSHNMSQTVDTTEIRAGQRNDVLATIKNNKTIEVTIEDVQQQRDFIAMMLGAEVKTGQKVDAYVLPQGIEVKEGKFTFGKNCLGCTACSFSCPKDAFNIGMLQGWKVNGAYNFSASPERQKGKHERYCKKAYDKYFANAEKEISKFLEERDIKAV